MLVPILFLVWGYAQPAYNSVVTAGANAFLYLIEAGNRVTSLVAAGSRIEVYSALREDGQPVTVYSADLLQFYLVLSLSFAIAYPRLDWRRRARAGGLTLAALLAFQVAALLITVENTYANALVAFAGRHYAPWESAVYRWLYEIAAHLAIQLLPAAVLVSLYARHGGFQVLHPEAPLRDAESDPAARGPVVRRRPLAVAVIAIAGLVAGAVCLAHLSKVRARRAEAHCVRGFHSLLAGLPKDAERAFASAIAIAPRFLEAHDGNGAARLKSGDATGAVAEYRQALAIEPGYFASRLGLANALEALGRDTEALDEFNRAHALSPTRWEPSFNSAVVLLRNHRAAEAEAALREAIRLGPQVADARFDLARLLLTSGRLCEALPHLEAYQGLAPGSPHAQLVRMSIATVLKECGGVSPTPARP